MFGPHDDDALGRGIRSWTDAFFFTTPGNIEYIHTGLRSYARVY